MEYLLVLAALLLVLILGLTLLPGLMRSSYRDAASGMNKDNDPVKVRAIFSKDEPQPKR